MMLALVAVAATGCASAGAVPTPRPFPGAPAPPRAPEPVTINEPGDDIPAASRPLLVTTALTFRGTPYRNGGSDPSGFDCSGFVQWVFAQHGSSLPREVRDQYRTGAGIDQNDVRPGDLVFFETVSRGASHVGIAIG